MKKFQNKAKRIKLPERFKPTFPSLLSVHDITPETLPYLREMVTFFQNLNIRDVYLLMVPGRKWKPEMISYIRSLCIKGYHLAGHGWEHEFFGKKEAFHRIHGAVFSRNAAEHYSLKNREEIKNLINRCYFWFQKAGLPLPHCYVPPAWAMGKISLKDLEHLPFRWYEFLPGIYDTRAHRFYRVPLMGFEADTAMRARLLTVSNNLNRFLASRYRLPYRIAIHPYDFHLKLRKKLKRLLDESKNFFSSLSKCFPLSID